MRAVKVGDIGAAVLASALAYVLRFGFGPTVDLFVVAAMPMVWLLSLSASGVYRASTRAVGSEEYRAIARAGFFTFAAMAIASYLLNAQLARAFVLPLWALLFVGTVSVHFVHRHHTFRGRKRGDFLRDTLVVGQVRACTEIIREMESSPTSGYRVVGVCLTEPVPAWKWSHISGVPIVGRASDVVDVVDRLGAEVVAVAPEPDLSGQQLRRLGWSLAERQVDLVVAPGILEVAGPRLSLHPVAGLSLLHVDRPADSWCRLMGKRLLDVALAGVITFFALPVGLIVAALIKLDSPGPVFFSQERVGAHGRPFRMIKFRSMCADAEARKADVHGGNQTNAVLFKVKADPRITRIGKVIRRLSIDELPQLINVLRGDMSLVGPRPPLPSEVERYEPDALQRLRVRPGMTGLWQTSGRSDLDWDSSLRLDLWYVDNWSPALDLVLLARTARVVLGGAGAY